jgi:hypothetical protein
MQSSARGINDLPPPTNGRFVTWLDWRASIAIRPRPTNLWFVYRSPSVGGHALVADNAFSPYG